MDVYGNFITFSSLYCRRCVYFSTIITLWIYMMTFKAPFHTWTGSWMLNYSNENPQNLTNETMGSLKFQSLNISETIFFKHKSNLSHLITYYERKYDHNKDSYNRSKWPPIKRDNSSLSQLICEFKRLPSHSFDREDAKRYNFNRPDIYPNHSFFRGTRFKSCALAGSSGGMLLVESGAEIDSHEVVVRFNEAVTEGYERHVGSKTTLRVVNSWIIHSIRKNKFNKDSLFNKREMRLWFDVPYYNDSPEQWHSRSETPGFLPAYIERKLMNNKDEDFILHTDAIWGQYKILQKYSDVQLPNKPPSSGFMTFIIMMNYCEEVNLYGFIRTLKWIDQCYYWKTYKEKDCDFQIFHPLPTEKKLYLELNVLDDYETFIKGKIRIMGFDKQDCR